MSANISVLELRDDADTLYKCLCIACEMLKELQIKKLSPTLQTLVDTLVRLEMTVSRFSMNLYIVILLHLYITVHKINGKINLLSSHFQSLISFI